MDGSKFGKCGDTRLKVVVNNQAIKIENNGSYFAPTAAEIYEVVFNGSSEIRGVALSEDDFKNLGVRFVEFVADPILVLEVSECPDATIEIQCSFKARYQGIEVSVATEESRLLDYGLDTKTWMPLPPGAILEAERILAELRLNRFGPISLGQYLELLRLNSDSITIENRTQKLLSATNRAEKLSGNVPSDFRGSLYDYQLAGFRWLSSMARNGLGAIIGDEMGLGKTIQVICLLLEECGRNPNPNLVLAPVTLLENWRRELLRFSPTLRVLVHSGSQRAGTASGLNGFDVVLCSFDTATADISMFRSVPWNFVVVDEAQNIKNPNAKRTLRLKTIQREHAIAVTGTPIENSLTDIWSIADFVFPSLLGSLPEFERRHPDNTDGANALEPLISPLILRRRVKDVAGDLPPRIDIPQPLELDPRSAIRYEAIRLASAGSSTSGFGIGALQQLRMFCTHPWLTDDFMDVADAADCSVKLTRLFEVLGEVVSLNGKAILFTSYSRSVDLIRTEVAERFGIFTDFIDGRVPINERQNRVDVFTKCDSSALLVLNPRAAGVGLNITAANHVLHFNLEWNPAVEDQASARAHRRGQTRPVTVHRFFYTNTVEEVISDRMQMKRDLAGTAVIGTDGLQNDTEDIIRALSLSPVRKNADRDSK